MRMRAKGERRGRRAKGEGEGRRAEGEGRRAKGEGRKIKSGYERRVMGDRNGKAGGWKVE
jgi:hypothetical protein